MNKKEKDQILLKILESIREDPLFQKELRERINRELLEHFCPRAYMTKVTKVTGEEITGEFKSEDDIDKFFLEKYNV